MVRLPKKGHVAAGLAVPEVPPPAHRPGAQTRCNSQPLYNIRGARTSSELLCRQRRMFAA